MSDLNVDETQEVIVRAGSTSANELEVNTDGSINVKVSSLPDNDTLLKTFLSVYEGSVGTAQTDTLLITNPAGSGKLLYLSGISITPVTNGRTFTARLYINPTITANGTLITRSSVQVTTTPPTSAVNVYSLPTISARGTLVRTYSSGQFQDTANLVQTNLMVISAGRSVLLTNLASSTNSDYAINLAWSEI